MLDRELLARDGASEGSPIAAARTTGGVLRVCGSARNNTSVEFSIEWRGWRLLFAGDAELRSWRTMARERVLRPVHFLKVSHHGSHNGTPDGEILDAILPPDPVDGERPIALVSTCADTYSSVPHRPTTEELKRRCEVLSTKDLGDAEYIDVEFWA